MAKTPLSASNLRLRRSFSSTKSLAQIPNLIELQKKSYEDFLQKDVSPEKRENRGLHGVFKSVFPIRQFNGSSELEYLGYHLDPSRYDVDECRQRGMTYAAPIKVTLRLATFNTEDEGEEKEVHDIKEQEVYMGEVPLMTDNGSFIINGTERVVVSQLHRSPGIFFSHDDGKSGSSNKYIYSARVIPYRGSWISFEFDQKDILYVSIDSRRKFPATILLKALGYDTEDLLSQYYCPEQVKISKKGKITCSITPEKMMGQKAIANILDPKSKEVIVKKGRRITRAGVSKIQSLKIKEIEIIEEDILGRPLASPIINLETGEVIADANTDLSKSILEAANECGIDTFKLLFFDDLGEGPYLRNTLLLDKVSSKEEALLEIYKRMRPGDPAELEVASEYFNKLFFNEDTYDLSEVGRVKLNHRLGISFDEAPVKKQVLTPKDLVLSVKTLIDLKNGQGEVDDIDHLGNRRVRSVGELLENQYRIGLVRMEWTIKERMNLQGVEAMMPHNLVNSKPLTAVVKEFIGSSQLSQFMDQVNPLAEITHKRRLSALGPGGLTRDRAGFEVRDVHPTHYGRICPIETSEGQNIGLIVSLATFAQINKHGFIETPYRRVKDLKVNDKVEFLSALEESGHYIAQVGKNIKDNKIMEDHLTVRRDGEYEVIDGEKISLMDVSPSQLVSIAASLIPFLEHDDANRALMGSNMQRQAVPLLNSRAPLVGTGVEKLVARDSGTSVVCQNDGVVQEVDASRIVVCRYAKKGKLGANVDIYNLVKYRRTNQNTCFNQKPIVRPGDHVKKGDVLADGPSAELGELALGRNVLVAFTPWMGYNFEDSILISENLVRDDVYTSIHIEEFECKSRDTKLGPEEITRDIANVGEEGLRNLDESGVIRIGAKVEVGDILVGKVTPKGETQVSPEEKLLRTIFGSKAGDYRDTSLRVPSGVKGTVIDAQVYSREGVKGGDHRLKEIIEEKKAKIEKDKEVEINAIKNNAIDKLKGLLVGQKTTGVLVSEDGSEELLKEKEKISSAHLESIPFELLAYIPLSPEYEKKASEVVGTARNQMDAVKIVFEEKISRLSRGDELAPGVIKMVKVYVAIKRKLQVGDKLTGRHGNKGVVARVLPQEDMPYLEDGHPVDMVLNPLGVPSRMNIGQVLECHLGFAAYGLGQKLGQLIDNFQSEKARSQLKEVYKNEDLVEVIEKADEESLKKLLERAKNGVHLGTPVFDGAKEEDVKDLLAQAGLPVSGQMKLFDGRTGETFQNPVTVGVKYMLKLHHLVEEKIHARSVGTYSLVSQQPLGGKAQFGGQRLGEMEVWAIEAYGAAYSLQEFLTVKSDDVAGRIRMYESIVKGENSLEPGLPESFNVLVKELQSLGLNLEMIESEVLTEAPSSQALPNPEEDDPMA